MSQPNLILRFTPTAWQKLLYLRDLGDTEIGVFGIATDPNDLLTINELGMVKQTCSTAKVDFDDAGIADFTDDQVDAGRHPSQFLRVWIHTHPGDSPNPSGVDETTFKDAFGMCDWAVMFILAKGGKTYGRIQGDFAGRKLQMEIPNMVTYKYPFGASDFDAWKKEYDKYVTKRSYTTGYSGGSGGSRHPQGVYSDDYPSYGGYIPGAYRSSGYGSHGQGGGTGGGNPAGFHTAGGTSGSRGSGSRGNGSAVGNTGTSSGGRSGSSAASDADAARSTPWNDADESWRDRFRRSREQDPATLLDKRRGENLGLFVVDSDHDEETGGSSASGAAQSATAEATQTAVAAADLTAGEELALADDHDDGEDTVVVRDGAALLPSISVNDALDQLAEEAKADRDAFVD